MSEQMDIEVYAGGTTGLATNQPIMLMPVGGISQMSLRYNMLNDFKKDVLKEGVDYGIVPGTNKPTLLKPGAEKASTFFGVYPHFEFVDRVLDWTGENHGGSPFFYFDVECKMMDGRGRVYGQAHGSCNSMEVKYAYRNVPAHLIPAHLDKSKLKAIGGKTFEFEFAIKKAETTGKYGKPASYWEAFVEAINSGKAEAKTKATSRGGELPGWEIDTTMYKIPNPDIADLVNTIEKMAEKRAYVAASLITFNLSEWFTQDLEDIEIDGNYRLAEAGKTADPKENKPTNQTSQTPLPGSKATTKTTDEPEWEDRPVDPDFPEAGMYVAPTEVATPSPKVQSQPSLKPEGNGLDHLQEKPKANIETMVTPETPTTWERKISPLVEEGTQYGFEIRKALDKMGYKTPASEKQIGFAERLFQAILPDEAIRHEVRWDVLGIADFKKDPNAAHPRIAAFINWLRATQEDTGEVTSRGTKKFRYVFPKEVTDAMAKACEPYLEL